MIKSVLSLSEQDFQSVRTYVYKINNTDGGPKETKKQIETRTAFKLDFIECFFVLFNMFPKNKYFTMNLSLLKP